MKWFIILFVMTISFLIIFKFLFFGDPFPVFDLSGPLENMSHSSSYINGSLFSLIIADDKSNIQDIFNSQKESLDINDLLTTSLTEIMTNKDDSRFSLNEIISNSNLTVDNDNNLKKFLILNGSLYLDIRNGNIVSFNVKISKIDKNGISPHTFEIFNLVVSTNMPIRLSQNETTIINGKAEIVTQTNVRNIDLYLIFRDDTMNLILEPKTLGSDYNGQPIYGLITYSS